ncbi:hypothetical protein [Streptomyces sp. SID3343]|uniref:hypothetical protein n=1 Tax=Streptomyces sp. SID3343 TaxID=2690260 RepID=UPI001368040A|nr:hypothetical protein [Streptomyces sp. SID3343]MYW02214.1 hypothetical protein [Streptomyces sp. SID3343]
MVAGGTPTSVQGVVLPGRGGAARLDGDRVEFRHGRTIRRFALRAVDRIVKTPDRRVTAHLRNGQWFTVRYRQEHAADAFVNVLTDRVRAVGPVPPGEAISIHTMRAGPSFDPHSPFVRGSLWVMGYSAGLALLVWAAVATRSNAAGASVFWVGFWYFSFGPWFVRAGWRRFLREWIILWRRGISVPATVEGLQRRPRESFGYPVYAFTAVDGIAHTSVSWMGVTRPRTETTRDVRYDPRNPGRVLGAVGTSYIVYWLVFGGFGLAVSAGAALVAVDVLLGVFGAEFLDLG